MRFLALLFLFFSYAAAAALPIVASDSDKLNAILKLVPNESTLQKAAPTTLPDIREDQAPMGYQDEDVSTVYGGPP
ncbi:hypothetical protein MMC10_006739 [Thelotrema lepadinum]|nr:hypothetical protein [Thelotrema lepadinum]